jgi:hypothetical protein
MAAKLLMEAAIGCSLFRDVKAKQNEGTLCENYDSLMHYHGSVIFSRDVDTPVMQVVETRLSSV